MKKVSMCWIAVFLSASLTGFAQTEINQAAALAGLDVGDSPGFPVTITQPGSYKLTGNLTTGTESGIEIRVDNVWIDLGGHTVRGNSTNAIGIYIISTQYYNARIANGTITGFDTAWTLKKKDPPVLSKMSPPVAQKFFEDLGDKKWPGSEAIAPPTPGRAGGIAEQRSDQKGISSSEKSSGQEKPWLSHSCWRSIRSEKGSS